MMDTSRWRRILLYGMQSSGASYVAWCLSQEWDRIAILDLHRPTVAPPAEEFGGQKALVKVTVDKGYTLADSIEAFQPDRVIIVLRDEAAVRASILRHYRNSVRKGAYLLRGPRDIDRKLARFHAVLEQRELYDQVIRYEEFAAVPRRLDRDLEEIIRYNHEHCLWCRPNRRPQRWGVGGIRVPEIPPEEWRWLALKLLRRYGRHVNRHGLRAREKTPNPFRRVACEG